METNQFKDKIKSNLGPMIVVGLGVVLIVGGLIYSLSNRGSKFKMPAEVAFDGQNCETEIQTYTVSGGTDIFPDGTEVQVEMNYYNCHRGQRDEIVMIKTPGRDTPLIKFIKMVPGDKYEVVEKGRGKYQIEVNGDEMVNSSGQEYEFSDRKSRMIKLYESNFRDGIKDGVYFVFGENTAGGFDSTRFGPITPERMIGRILIAGKTPAVTQQPEAVPETQTAVPEEKTNAEASEGPDVNTGVVAPAAVQPTAKKAVNNASQNKVVPRKNTNNNKKK